MFSFSCSVDLVQVEVKTMTMFDEQRVSLKFVGKLARALKKISEKSLPISDALRRAHAAMMKKACQLFPVATFNNDAPGDVNK